jgi:argininosuccinate lyase
VGRPLHRFESLFTGTLPNDANQLAGGLDPLMVSYNESIYYDRAFHTQDILGSIAWARANHKVGILTAEEFSAIESGLKKVEEEWVAGTFKIIPGVDEDIHTANERRLGEIIGKNIGGKLHTGRSRNEQVATDMRLWLRDELRKIEGFLVDFLKVTTARAENEIDFIMPGYTHLQRAQPIRWSHWMLSYAMAFASDLERLREVIKRVNQSIKPSSTNCIIILTSNHRSVRLWCFGWQYVWLRPTGVRPLFERCSPLRKIL